MRNQDNKQTSQVDRLAVEEPRPWFGIAAILILLGFTEVCFWGLNAPPQAPSESQLQAPAKPKISTATSKLHIAQVALESYVSDTPGAYPYHAHECFSYLPGGSRAPGGKPGSVPEFGKNEDWFVDLHGMDYEKACLELEAGQVGYFRSGDEHYKLVVADENGQIARGDNGKPLGLEH